MIHYEDWKAKHLAAFVREEHNIQMIETMQLSREKRNNRDIIYRRQA